MLKSELFELCKRFAPAPEFRLDQIARSAGGAFQKSRTLFTGERFRIRLA